MQREAAVAAVDAVELQSAAGVAGTIDRSQTNSWSRRDGSPRPVSNPQPFVVNGLLATVLPPVRRDNQKRWRWCCWCRRTTEQNGTSHDSVVAHPTKYYLSSNKSKKYFCISHIYLEKKMENTKVLPEYKSIPEVIPDRAWYILLYSTKWA